MIGRVNSSTQPMFVIPGKVNYALELHFSFQEPPLSFQRYQGMNIWSAKGMK